MRGPIPLQGVLLLLLPLAVGCAPSDHCPAELVYVGAGQEVSAIGDFNGQNPWADPLTRRRDGSWRVTLELPPGDYAYRFSVDGQVINDPFAHLLTWRDGEDWPLLRVEDCRAPRFELRSARADASGELEVEATFRGQGLQELRAWSRSAGPLEARRRGDRVRIHGERLPPGKHTVHLEGADRAGRTARLRVPLWVEDEPFRWEDAIIYQVMVDRFAGPAGEALPGGAPIGDRQGGHLAGVLARLDWIEALGANALWLSPLQANATGHWPGFDGRSYEGYHGYWVTDSHAVEPAFGSDEDLLELSEAAHARGIRLILDVVPNHVHQEHPWVQQHPEWFDLQQPCVCGGPGCPWSGDIRTCWFTEYLPDLDWTEPEAAATVVQASLDWVGRYDLDGFRVDAVPMMPRSAIRELTWALARHAEQGGVRFYTLGETFTTSTQTIRANLGPFGLDGQFEFPILWAVRDWLGEGEGSAEEVAEAITSSLEAWSGSGSVMAPFVGNHDLPRFLSVAAGHDTSRPWEAPPPQPAEAAPYLRLILAQTLAFTLPGAPVLYYGDEVGLAGAGDPDCRRVMDFDPVDPLQQEVLEQTRKLGLLRRSSTALRRGAWRALLAQGDTLVYLRDAGAGQVAVVALHDGLEPATIGFSWPEGLAAPSCLDLAFGSGPGPLQVSAAGPTSLELPPLSATIWEGACR